MHMMRGTVAMAMDEGAGKPRDIVRTQHTNLILTPPHTHPPTLMWSPRRVLVTRSRPPPHGYDHTARTPDALRTGYDNPARTPNSPSRKAMRRGTATRHPRTPVNPPPPAPTHTALRVCCARRRGGGRCAQGGHTERGAVQPERRMARGCTASTVSSHAHKGWRMHGRGSAGRGGVQPKGRPHANGGVYARGWCPPAFSQRREDVAARETKGAGTLSAPSRPVNRLRKISVK
ncbi:hypothetical protein BJY52DRAFT_1342546 [Lactarius psammicola]|nr:hypothetical protein BJY52DRAFT_1342546 [Lactarius psammicola]